MGCGVQGANEKRQNLDSKNTFENGWGSGFGASNENQANLDSKSNHEKTQKLESKSQDSKNTSKNTESKTANLLLSTHKCKESQIQAALNELDSLKEVLQKPFMIRIEK